MTLEGAHVLTAVGFRSFTVVRRAVATLPVEFLNSRWARLFTVRCWPRLWIYRVFLLLIKNFFDVPTGIKDLANDTERNVGGKVGQAAIGDLGPRVSINQPPHAHLLAGGDPSVGVDADVDRQDYGEGIVAAVVCLVKKVK